MSDLRVVAYTLIGFICLQFDSKVSRWPIWANLNLLITWTVWKKCTYCYYIVCVKVFELLRKCVIIYKNITIILLSIHITKRQYGIQYFRAQCDVQWIILKSQSPSTSDYKDISNSSCSYYMLFDEPMYP